MLQIMPKLRAQDRGKYGNALEFVLDPKACINQKVFVINAVGGC
jgi:hypothetical protein